jgi:OOP family OmpA-OmpF porin
MRMKTRKGLRLLQMTALAAFACPFAQAQEPGWYLGANVGPTRAKIDDPGITQGLLGNGFTGVAITDHNSSTGFKLFGGYQTHATWFALEGGYFNLGKFSYDAATLPPGNLNGQIKLQGVDLDAVFTLPITKRFSAFARGGAIYVQAKDAFNGSESVTVANASPSKDIFSYTFGGGLQYQITRKVGLRAEAQRYRINDAVGNKGDIDLYSLGLLVRFGHHAVAPVQAAAAPVPVPTPPPETTVVIVPVVAATAQYCTILDLQFDIDRDEILREDKEKLAVVGTFLTKYTASTAVIEGHADNIGTEDHNMALSKRRAEKVVTYLVDELHIDRSRLSSVGFGDTRPITENDTEAGRRRNRRIDAVIACVTDLEGLPVAPARMTMALAIEFDQDQAVIKPEYDAQLEKVARFLKANPTVTATVEGHTGNLKGSRENAMEVSSLRAQKVVDYLVDHFGISASRLTAQGLGSSRRFAYNTSLEGQEENRRVNIIIDYPK